MTPRSSPRSAVPIATRLVCPCCGGPVARVEKGFLERLLGPVFGAKRRYRCTIVTCGWTASESVEAESALLRAWHEGTRRDPTGEDSARRRPGFGR